MKPVATGAAEAGEHIAELRCPTECKAHLACNLMCAMTHVKAAAAADAAKQRSTEQNNSWSFLKFVLIMLTFNAALHSRTATAAAAAQHQSARLACNTLSCS